MESGICLVCSDSGGSRHYGSICCSGCKGFFRRTVRFKRKYECSFDKNCVIHKEFRNCCRACRYDKCLKVGLNPLMVHSDRVPQNQVLPEEAESREIAVKSEPCSSTSTSMALVKSSKTLISKRETKDDFEDEINHWHSLIIKASKQLCDANNMTLGAAKIIPIFNPSDFRSVSKYFILVEKLIDDFFETDRNHVFATSNEHLYSLNVPVEKAFKEPREMSRRSKIDWTGRYFPKASALHKIWCRIMSHYVDWTSHIPELHQLSDEDQLQMMISRSIPCVWLMICHRSMIYNTNGVSISGGTYFPRDEEEQKQIDKEIYPFLKRICDWVTEEFIDPAKEMKIGEEEYALLRILCFFMPVSTLSPKGKIIIKQARNFYRNILIQTITDKFPNWTHEQICNRISQLLCFLPVMETAGRIEDDSLAVMTLFNVAEMQGELTYEIHVRKTQ